jgi:quinol monooxygenase YgiN
LSAEIVTYRKRKLHGTAPRSRLPLGPSCRHRSTRANINSRRPLNDAESFIVSAPKIRLAKVHHEKGFDMLTITAVIRAKKGHEDTMRRALLEVAENVRGNEPDTIGFFVSQEQDNPTVFTTYERFLDQAAMDAHNNSAVVARFFGVAKPILDGDVILVTSTEISAKP